MMKHFSNLDLSCKRGGGVLCKKNNLIVWLQRCQPGCQPLAISIQETLSFALAAMQNINRHPLPPYSICMGVAYDIIMKSYMMYRPSKFTSTK